jgi:hypothetical protein
MRHPATTALCQASPRGRTKAMAESLHTRLLSCLAPSVQGMCSGAFRGIFNASSEFCTSLSPRHELVICQCNTSAHVWSGTWPQGSCSRMHRDWSNFEWPLLPMVVALRLYICSLECVGSNSREVDSSVGIAWLTKPQAV